MLPKFVTSENMVLHNATYYFIDEEGTMMSVFKRSSRLGNEVVVNEMMGYRNKEGYHKFSLSSYSQAKPIRRGVIMLRTFVGAPPDGYTCDHKDRVRNNDKLENLRWASPSEQIENQERGGVCSRESYIYPDDWQTHYPLFQHPCKFLFFFTFFPIFTN